MSYTRYFFIATLALLLSFKCKAQNIIPYTQNYIGQVSKVFKAKVNNKPVKVTQYKGIHYIRLGQKGIADFSIDLLQKLDSISISPDLAFSRSKDKIQFSLQKPGYYVLSSAQGEMLFILADKPADLSRQEQKELKNIKDYQVDPTGNRICTQQLQRAINETAAGHQILYIGPGIYKTGTLTIGSGTRIFISEGAVINGAADSASYITDKGFAEVNKSKVNADNGEYMTFSRLLLIENAQNVKIWGAGIFNGNGAELRKKGKPANLFRIRNSRNVLIEGICLFDPAAWNTHILYSDSVTIKNVKIINDPNVPNTDGIDPDASRHVLVKDCFAYCSDDNIAIKSSNNSNLLRDCEDITVENCVFLTKKSALKVGTETKAANMRQIVFKNNWIVAADRGLVLYCYDGAHFDQISFINNRFERGYADYEKKAIHFVVKDRYGKGSITNVLIRDCFFSSRFHHAIEITGLDKDHTITNIVFQNVSLFGKKITDMADLHIKQNAYVGKMQLVK